MTRYLYKNLKSHELRELSEPKSGTWIYVESPDVDELKSLAEKFELDEGLLCDALDEDEMPRLEKQGEQSYIYVRFVYISEEGEIKTAPLLFVFGLDQLITVSMVKLPSIESFLTGKIEFATTQRAKLVLQVLQQISEHYDAYIATAAKHIKAIRARLRGHDISNQDFVDFVTLEDELNEFLSSLLPTNATLRRLLLGRYMPLFEEDQDIVEDLLLNNEQSIEACRSNMKSIRNIREAYSAISSNNLNRSLKILTVATVLITIPLSVTAIYSMNVHLPGEHDPNAFWIIMAVILAIMIILVVIGRRKRIL